MEDVIKKSLLRNPNYDETVIIDGQVVPKDKDFFVMLPRYMHQKGLTVPERFFLSMQDIWGSQFYEVISAYIPHNKFIRIRNSLRKKGYKVSEKLSPEEIKALTIQRSHKGKKCEWCGRECYTLHEHHFPIQKRKGGTETVSICPNCHYTYHALMQGNRGG